MATVIVQSVTRANSYAEARDRMTRSLILKALDKNEWNIMRSARYLGINRTYIYRLMKRYGIERSVNGSQEDGDGFP